MLTYPYFSLLIKLHPFRVLDQLKMRRSGAPSIRRGQGGCVAKSNEEILALLSSSSGGNKSSNVYTPPSSTNHTLNATQRSPFASPKLPSFSTARLAPTLPANNRTLHEDTGSVGNAAGEKGKYSYFTCVWGKKSGRKHKKWEGDGIVKGGWTFDLISFICILEEMSLACHILIY